MLVRLTMVVAVAAVTLLVPLSGPAGARACQPSPSAAAPAAPVGVDVPLVTKETRIRWTRVPIRTTFGDGISLEGQVVTDDGAVVGAAVDLYARPSGTEKWALIGSTSSDQDTGVFTFGCLFPERTTAYRASYAGTTLYAATEGTREVDVARLMPDAMHQVSPSRLGYSGSVAPRYSGAVTLQRRDCPTCAWRGVASSGTDPRSRWRFLIDVSGLHGEYAYRALIPADEHFGRSLSERVWRITVR